MYENRHGRFRAVDPLLASGKSADPQTFNRFVYVGNRPTLLIDPSGLTWYQRRNKEGRLDYKWSPNDKKFEDDSSIEGWDQVDFGFSATFFYNGCTDAACSSTRPVAMYRNGGWDFTDSASYMVRQLFEDERRIISKNLSEMSDEFTNGFRRTRHDWNLFSSDPLGEKGLGSPGLAFVTGGLTQEANLLKGVRFASNPATEGAKDIVLFEQYSLRATRDGFYPVMRRGFKEPVDSIFLKKGEIWKFGETMNPTTRYSQRFLRENGLGYAPEFKTPGFKEVLQVERRKIVEYEALFGKLPPGNKIRK